MKKISLIIFCLILNNFVCNHAFAYGSGVRVQKDYRFTTQQDRNKRIETYQTYLKNTGIFEEDHYKYKEIFKAYKKDEHYQANLDHIKHNKPLPQSGYKVKGNYYHMADKILANYSVIYDENPDTEFIYNTFGQLYQVTFLTGEEYILPHYKAVYSFNGYLQKVHFFAIDGYEYIFLPNGDLQGVVIDNKLYNRVGRPFKVWAL